ncbi:MAG: hypothetical protein MSIBF_01330 [Candidatus Altiarchaeales archaeon IMC4]|nr:MAG: hypothetical protein MSIBF_01330 [Candidatus Altiarchaeales archaeon IMC4]
MNLASSLSKASSFVIDIPTKVTVELLEKKTKTGDNPAKKVADNVMDFFGKDMGYRISVDSEVPLDFHGRNEAVSVAAALAVAGALSAISGSVNELLIDKNTREQFFVVNEKVVNKLDLLSCCCIAGNRFDMLAAAMFGGFAVCDNSKKEILRRGEMEELDVVVLLRHSKKPPIHTELEIAFNEALKGNLYTAMKIGGIINGSGEVIEKLLKPGAISVSESNGLLIALVRDKKRMPEVSDTAKSLGEIITAKTSNFKASVPVKPRRLVKMVQFLKLKGKDEFYWL